MKIKATIDKQELEIEVDVKDLVKAGYVKTKKEYKRWRAKQGGEYWYHSVYGHGYRREDTGDSFDNSNYRTGNYYKTSTECLKVRDRQLALVRVNDRIMELNRGWKPDWDDENQQKYYVQYEHGADRISYGSLYTWEIPNRLDYVKSSDVAFQIISECEDDLKVIFGV